MITLTFRFASAVLAIATMLTVATVSADAQVAGPKADNAKKALVKSNKQLKPPGGAGNIQTALAMGCNESIYYAPNNGGYLNVVAMPNSGDPAIATATSSVSNHRPTGRVRPGGTDGGIEVTSGGSPGGTTMITYVLENFEGEQVTVDLTVTVDCKKPAKPKKNKKQKKVSWDVDDPNPDPYPPISDPGPPSNVPPTKSTIHTNHIPTHRETTCTPCRKIAEQLNAVIDKLSSEMQVSSNGQLVGKESAAADYQQYETLLTALENCEHSCPPPGQTTGYIDPPFVVIIERKIDEDHRKSEDRKDDYRKDEPKKSSASRANTMTNDRKPTTASAMKSTSKATGHLGHAAMASHMANFAHAGGTMSHLGNGMMHLGGMHMGGMLMGKR